MDKLRRIVSAGVLGLAGLISGGCEDTPTTDSEFSYWTGAILQANALNNPNLSPRTAGNVALAGDAMRGYAPMAQQREINDGAGNQQGIVQGSGYQPPVQSNNENGKVSPEVIEIIRKYCSPKVSAN